MPRPSPFSGKQEKLLDDALPECQQCAAKLAVLRRLNIPNELLEQQNNYNLELIKSAKAIAEEFKRGEGSDS